jgi:hypothetical protein
MYCSYCHNAPNLSERNFANFRNVTTHMRVRANLTGKEYAKLMEFLRRWQDVGPPHPPLEPGPTRFHYAQPIPELREQAPANPVAPQGQAAGEPATSDGQPPVVASSPQASLALPHQLP